MLSQLKGVLFTLGINSINKRLLLFSRFFLILFERANLCSPGSLFLQNSQCEEGATAAGRLTENIVMDLITS